MARVLIIDDDKMINDAMSQAVEGLGHEAEGVYTLKDGLKRSLRV